MRTFLVCRREPLNLMEERVFYLKNTRPSRSCSCRLCRLRRRSLGEFTRTRKLFRSFCIASVKKTLKFIIFNARISFSMCVASSVSLFTDVG